MGTLHALKKNINVAKIAIHLWDSRYRVSRELPQIYREKRVYVFSTRTRNSVPLETKLPVGNWEERDLPNSTLRSVPWRAYAFLVARANDGKDTRANRSAQREGESVGDLKTSEGTEGEDTLLATSSALPRKVVTGMRAGSEGANKFEMLGIVKLVSLLPLPEIVSLNTFVYQTMYTTKPCTIKIV